jgi:hypothetical protein
MGAVIKTTKSKTGSLLVYQLMFRSRFKEIIDKYLEVSIKG